MAKLVEQFARIAKVEAACMQKDDPAPVYLLDEILELARSSPEQAQGIADLVEKKLASRSPVVKFKALRVIKHLCTKGCATFQRCMQKHSGAVRELVHWRGEPDPFKGDVPNARVREFAKEVLEVMFNANPVATAGPSAGSLAAQGRIQGFGSGGPGPDQPGGRGSHGGGGHYSGGGGGGGGGSGFSGGMGALSSAAASLGEGPLAAGVATVASAINDFLGNPSARAGLTGSRYGGGGGGSPSRHGGYGGFEPMGGLASSSAAAAAPPRVTPAQVLGSEEGLVDDICAPGGLRPVPDASDLRRFVEAASAMDGLRLAELLRAKMEGAGSSWQVSLRALCALEAVLQRGSSQACGEVAVMFQSEPTPIQALATAQQQLVRDAAARCLRLLLGDDAVPSQPEAAAGAASGAGGGGKKGGKPHAAAAPARDLLSLDDDGPAPGAAPPAAAAGVDLLDDLAGALGAAPAAPAAAGPLDDGASMFSGLQVRAGAGSSNGNGSALAAAAPAGGALGDLFGGLLLSPGGAAAPAAAPAAGSSPAARPPLDDLFSGITAPSPSSSSNPGPAPAGGLVQQQAWGSQLLPAAQQPHPQQQQQQNAAQAFGALGGHAPGALKAAPNGGLGIGGHGRGLSGGAGGSGSGSGAAQQPWSGGITKDHPAFDFVLDEFRGGKP